MQCWVCERSPLRLTATRPTTSTTSSLRIAVSAASAEPAWPGTTRSEATCWPSGRPRALVASPPASVADFQSGGGCNNYAHTFGYVGGGNRVLLGEIPGSSIAPGASVNVGKFVYRM